MRGNNIKILLNIYYFGGKNRTKPMDFITILDTSKAHGLLKTCHACVITLKYSTFNGSGVLLVCKRILILIRAIFSCNNYYSFSNGIMSLLSC